jgi:CheY-like chemotaxis protein
MPDLTGYDVLRALQHDAATARIPVVIYTAQTVTDEDRRKLAGAVAIVSTPTGSR